MQQALINAILLSPAGVFEHAFRAPRSGTVMRWVTVLSERTFVVGVALARIGVA
jgi:hypothetical protein